MERYCVLPARGTPCVRMGLLFSYPMQAIDEHLSFTAQIINLLSPLLSSVNTLANRQNSYPPPGKEEVDPSQWLEVFQPLTHVKRDHVNEEYVPDIVNALVTEEMATGVLP
jgi:hypothetical protein